MARKIKSKFMGDLFNLTGTNQAADATGDTTIATNTVARTPTEEKVRHLLKVSLFLQETERLAWEQGLANMNEDEMKELETILLDEDATIASLVQEEAKKPESSPLQKVFELKKRVVDKMVKKEEAAVEKTELTKADELLDSLSSL